MERNYKEISLDDIYYNTKNKAAFSSPKTLSTFLKQNQIKLKGEQPRKWLLHQKTYTLHKPRRNKFQRNSYNLTNIGDFWQADLMDMQSLSRKNSGYKYILAVIDCFSKFAWCVPLKKKQPAEIIRGFEIIFEQCDYKPRNLHTDKGGEFTAKLFQKFLTDNNIVFYEASDPTTKAAICERYIRTMKSLIFKYFTYTNSQRYCDVLQSFVVLYNSRFHRSIGMAPVDVNEKNILQVWEHLRKNTYKKKEPLLKCDDFVRLAKAKEIFAKGYKPLWTSEIFKILKVIAHTRPVYKIADLDGNAIKGSFYEPELQKVTISEGSD